MLLLLKRAPDVEASLQAKITALHTSGGPEFHRWLTAEQLGAQFGANSQDLETIKGWLHSHGFTINQVYKNGLVLDISGTAGQIRETFHTEIHNLVLPNGEKHIAITRDPQIPAALGSAVAGAPLHNFFAGRTSPEASGELRPHDQSWQPQYPFRGFQPGRGVQCRRPL